jgi:hypothetical protein
LVPHQKACKINPMIKKHYVSNAEKANMANNISNQPIGGGNKQNPY